MRSKQSNGTVRRTHKSKQNTSDPTLLDCLRELSSIGKGRDSKMDRMIQQFKKMIKIGSSVADLQKQILVIKKALTAASAKPDNNQQIQMFKQLPAEIMIDEFLDNSLSDNINMRLQNYRDSIIPGTTVMTCISDLIELLKSDSISSETSQHNTESNTDIKDLIRPLLRLFNQLELSPEQNETLQQISHKSDKLTDLDGLGSFLESVSDLILSSVTNYSKDFETFLMQLKTRLDTVNSCIQTNSDTSRAISDCGNNLSQHVNSQVNDIQSSFRKTDNIVDLEAIIAKSLESVIDGVNNFDNERKELEQQAAHAISNLSYELEQTRSKVDYLKENLQQQNSRALTDQLTKLPNRHAYHERLKQEYARWQRYKHPFSLILGDIDFFKKINDTYGHIAGDTALLETAKILQNGIRGTDFVARFGGEEFVILLPETTLKTATIAINKVRKLVQQNIIHESNADIQLTISFGVAAFEANDTSIAVLERADKALYRAKSKGRNQVCVERKH